MFSKEPINNVEWRDASSINANGYNPNVVFTPELKLLEKSILKCGWIQPVIINPDNIIIDGFHRWTLSQVSQELKAKYDGKVPCAVLDVSDVEAMVITVRINRAKGTHLAFRMSEYVRELVEKHGIPMDDLAKDIGATFEEIQLLMKSDMFEHKDVENWAYSEAWFPVESGRTRLPTLFDFVDGKEVIKNKERQTLMGEKFLPAEEAASYKATRKDGRAIDPDEEEDEDDEIMR